MKHNGKEQFGSTDDYYTPAFIFEALGVEFDLDVASSGSEKIEVPAIKSFTKEDDGLAQDWSGFVWMNPPFSKPTPWVEKFIAHGNGIALLPFTRGKWWATIWASDALIVPLPSNLKFNRHEGKPLPVTFHTSLYALGEKGKEALHKSNFGKVR
jgi:hypothetical protein